MFLVENIIYILNQVDYILMIKIVNLKSFICFWKKKIDMYLFRLNILVLTNTSDFVKFLYVKQKYWFLCGMACIGNIYKHDKFWKVLFKFYDTRKKFPRKLTSSLLGCYDEIEIRRSVDVNLQRWKYVANNIHRKFTRILRRNMLQLFIGENVYSMRFELPNFVVNSS